MSETDLLASLTTYYIAGAFMMTLMLMILNHFHRRAYLIIWSLSWAVLFVAYFSLYYGLLFEVEPLYWIYGLFIFIGMFFQHKGAFLFMDRAYPKNRFYLVAAMLVIFLTLSLIRSVSEAGLHSLFFFSGVLYLDAGHAFYRSRKRPFIIYGGVLTVYGALIALYPHTGGFLAFTSMLNAFFLLFGMAVAYGMVAMHLVNVHEREQALQESLYYLSYHDHLTGHRNRVYLESFLDILDESGGMNAAILMADLDTLKNINDRHGHHAGDRMIIRAGEVLFETTDETDLLVRYGGDEFVVVYANRDQEDMEKIAQSIQKRMQEESVEDVTLSFSIGFSVHQGDGSVHDTLRIAEKRMYDDKRSKQMHRH